MHHHFLINPSAGKKKGQSLKEKIDRFFMTSDLSYSVEYTKPDLSVSEQSRTAALSHPEGIIIYACGGDGTIGGAAAGIAGISHASVTQIPVGSGNDFLRLFGTTSSLFSDLQAQIDGTRTLSLNLIDLGDHLLGLNVCSAGLDARINADVSKYKQLPGVSAWLAYRISLAVNFVKGLTRTMTVTLNNETHTESVTLAACCNGQYYGSNFRPVPEACPDDDMLDFLVVKQVTRRKALPLISAFEKGQWKSLGNLVRYHRGTSMTLSCDTPMPINIDGETIWKDSVTFRLSDQKVLFHLPRGAQPIWLPEESAEM